MRRHQAPFTGPRREMSETMQIDRADAAAWARDLLSRSDWVVLDTETCGLNEMAHICEIAVIRPDGETLINTRVRPVIPIPAEATAIHGITGADVATAPSIHVALEMLTSRLAGIETIVTYNAGFDIHALDLSLHCGMNGLMENSSWALWIRRRMWECAMMRYAAWYGEWSDYRGGYLYQSLNGGHSALEDCWACLNRIRKMAGETPLTRPGSRGEKDQS